MLDDATLLRRYARDRSEPDFAEIVRRHLNLVYSAALRQVNGDSHLAQDIAQLVFTDLARKAADLANHRALVGWLFLSTRYAAAKLIRGERRRQAREQEAQLMQELSPPDPAATLDWAKVGPVIDDALSELSEIDREAILLRYLQGCDFGQVGARLSLSDNAARMRVDRAVDKLRAQLARRGVTSTAGALALALTGHAVVAAPAGLAASVTGTALAGVAASGTVATLTFMSLSKLKIGIAAAVVVAGTASYVVQEKTNATLRKELADVSPSAEELIRLRDTNRQLAESTREAMALRVTDQELARLRTEAGMVQQRIQATPVAATTPAPASARIPGNEFSVKELDQLPKLNHPHMPVYPAAMAAAGISGDVTVEMVIDAKGNVAEVKALRSSHREFEMPALEAVAQWKFDPGRKGGRLVNTRVTQLIQFNLNDQLPPEPATWF